MPYTDHISIALDRTADPKKPDLLVLFQDRTLAAHLTDRNSVSVWHIEWPGRPAALLERMDYLTSIFPFDLLEVSESEPGSGNGGHWKIVLLYTGSEKAHAHMLQNLFSLVTPRRPNLAT